jgi:hypothetical protein
VIRPGNGWSGAGRGGFLGGNSCWRVLPPPGARCWVSPLSRRARVGTWLRWSWTGGGLGRSRLGALRRILMSVAWPRWTCRIVWCRCRGGDGIRPRGAGGGCTALALNFRDNPGPRGRCCGSTVCSRARPCSSMGARSGGTWVGTSRSSSSSPDCCGRAAACWRWWWTAGGDWTCPRVDPGRRVRSPSTSTSLGAFTVR